MDLIEFRNVIHSNCRNLVSQSNYLYFNKISEVIAFCICNNLQVICIVHVSVHLVRKFDLQSVYIEEEKRFFQ